MGRANLRFLLFSYFMLGIRSLVKGLGVFERNRVPLELKILGLAFYIQHSSLRRWIIIRYKVSKTALEGGG